jgi:hypothetical protein
MWIGSIDRHDETEAGAIAIGVAGMWPAAVV